MPTPILIAGAAGRVGVVRRTVTELLLKQGKAVRVLVRTEDNRAQALRGRGAEVVIADLLDLESMHRAVAGCETVYFSMSVSPDYLGRDDQCGSDRQTPWGEGLRQHVADDGGAGEQYRDHSESPAQATLVVGQGCALFELMFEWGRRVIVRA